MTGVGRNHHNRPNAKWETMANLYQLMGCSLFPVTRHTSVVTSQEPDNLLGIRLDTFHGTYREPYFLFVSQDDWTIQRHTLPAFIPLPNLPLPQLIQHIQRHLQCYVARRAYLHHPTLNLTINDACTHATVTSPLHISFVFGLLDTTPTSITVMDTFHNSRLYEIEHDISINGFISFQKQVLQPNNHPGQQ
jgi:hypothetical protein